MRDQRFLQEWAASIVTSISLSRFEIDKKNLLQPYLFNVDWNWNSFSSVVSQLVGGQFDLEMNFIIQEPESIGCMVELLDKCEPTCQAEVWSIFTAILKKSVRNLQACTEVGLIQQVLDRITTTDSMIAGGDTYCCFNLCVNFGDLKYRWNFTNVPLWCIKLWLPSLWSVQKQAPMFSTASLVSQSVAHLQISAN